MTKIAKGLGEKREVALHATLGAGASVKPAENQGDVACTVEVLYEGRFDDSGLGDSAGRGVLGEAPSELQVNAGIDAGTRPAALSIGRLGPRPRKRGAHSGSSSSSLDPAASGDRSDGFSVPFEPGGAGRDGGGPAAGAENLSGVTAGRSG